MTKLLIVAALPLALAACDKAKDAPKPADGAAMGNMAPDSAMPTEVKVGTGEGKVISLNAETEAISLEHGPIKEIGWPGMTMGFSAKPELLKGIAVGDTVTFAIKGSGSDYEVTAISRK